MRCPSGWLTLLTTRHGLPATNGGTSLFRGNSPAVGRARHGTADTPHQPLSVRLIATVLAYWLSRYKIVLSFRGKPASINAPWNPSGSIQSTEISSGLASSLFSSRLAVVFSRAQGHPSPSSYRPISPETRRASRPKPWYFATTTPRTITTTKEAT